MNSDLKQEANLKFKESVNFFEDSIKKIQTGRAHPSMLDGVLVEVYGTKMPINQTAGINAVEAQLLQLTPFDPSNLQSIADAIRNEQSLGLNPVDDGRVIRVPIPPLTTERRQQIVKQLKEKTEDAQIRLRNIRHDLLKTAKQLQSDKDISQDDYSRLEKAIAEEMESVKNKIEEIAKQKEEEILTV